jgi:hypothetical protein
MTVTSIPTNISIKVKPFFDAFFDAELPLEFCLKIALNIDPILLLSECEGKV